MHSTLQYFQAVQEGRRRASQAQMRLFDAAGFAMLTLTTKKTGGRFQPVGEEECAAIIRTDEGDIVIVCDQDGFTKAQSKPLAPAEASGILRRLLDDGMARFGGKTITIWTQTHPVI